MNRLILEGVEYGLAPSDSRAKISIITTRPATAATTTARLTRRVTDACQAASAIRVPAAVPSCATEVTTSLRMRTPEHNYLERANRPEVLMDLQPHV